MIESSGLPDAWHGDYVNEAVRAARFRKMLSTS